MANGIELKSIQGNTDLNEPEKKEIETKIDFEIVNGHYKTLKIGSIANVIGGFFYVFFIFGQVNTKILLTWYLVLITASFADILWARQYESSEITLRTLHAWRKGFLPIIAVLCLTWGSIGILFVNGSNQQQIITLAFLLAVLISFGFTTITDFTLALISISCLLVPTILYRISIGIHSIVTLGHDKDFSIGISLALWVLGMFLIVVSYMGKNVVRKFFRLNFEINIFSRKIANMNKILEKRVKERTAELESSLTLVKFQATHDLLTQLPNSRSLIDYLENTLERAARDKSMFAVIIFSLNGMTKILDGLGPQACDIIITRVAQRFNTLFATQANSNIFVTISRRDEFVLVLNPIANEKEIEITINELFSILKDPFHLENQTIKLSASVGLSIYPKDGFDVNTIMMNADIAKIRAGERGGNSYNFYDAIQNANLLRQIDIEYQMHNTIKNKELKLHYQPIIDVDQNKIVCVEALIRWFNPKLGLLMPDEFIHIAETNGMIVPIGLWVFKTACKQLVEWHQKGFTDLKISINLSYRQLLQKHVVAKLIDILAQTKLSPHYVELELLERDTFQHDAIPILNQLKGLGVTISIDDFGTGYSALSSLKLIQIDKIKIDKSFVQDITTNSDSRNIVITTISLASGMNTLVVAEGVETKEQLKFLQSHGCHLIQGFYFSKPVDGDAFLAILKNQSDFIASKMNIYEE